MIKSPEKKLFLMIRLQTSDLQEVQSIMGGNHNGKQNDNNKTEWAQITFYGWVLRKQLDDSSFKNLSFEERFGLMVNTEWARRKK